MLTEIVGWLGVFFVILAYILVTSKKLSSSSKTYHFLNLIGAIGIGFNAYTHGAIPSIGSNSIWAIIAIYGLYRAFK